VRAALFHALRILKPGGVLLATLPAVSRINYEDGGLDHGDFWRFTEGSLQRMLGELLPAGNFEVIPCGNLKVCIAFLYGVGLEEVPETDLTVCDSQHPLIFCIRAVKPFELPTAMIGRAAPPPQLGAILMYHRISELQIDPHNLCVSPTEFREHMQYLVRQHPVLSLEDMAQCVANGVLPEKAVAVTIDDGTLDGLENASPILRELGIPATFFVNTERFNEEHEPWWEVLGRIFHEEGPLPPKVEIQMGPERQVFPTGNRAERSSAYSTIHRFLMRSTLEQREETMQCVTKWSALALAPRKTHRVLLPNEVRRLAEQPGHSIGAHSVHHLLLPLQSAGEQEREIANCKHDLEG